MRNSTGLPPLNLVPVTARRAALWLAALALIVLASACSKAGFQTTDIYRAGPDGVMVTWETDGDGRVVDKDYDHPATIDAERVAAILADFRYSEHSFFQWRAKGQMFDEREVKKLAKPLSRALAACDKNQWVTFEVTSYKRDLLFKSRKLATGWVWVKDGKLNVVFGNFLFDMGHDDNDDPFQGDPRSRYSIATYRVDAGPYSAAPAHSDTDPFLKKEHLNWAVIDLANWQPRPSEEDEEEGEGTETVESPAPAATPAPVQAPAAVPAESPDSPAEQKARSVEDRLRELQDLLDKGLITPEEYELKRQEILKAL